MEDYKSLSEMIEEIETTGKKLCQRVYDFFRPLKELYVTEETNFNIKIKKFLWFSSFVEDDHITTYKDLLISVYPTFDDTVNVRIFSKIHPTHNIFVEKEFPCSVFDANDYTIMHDETIKNFIRKFLAIAIPKWKKYKAYVAHITDEKKKCYVAECLEDYSKRSDFKERVKNDNTENVLERIRENIKVFENAWDMIHKENIL